MCNNRNKLVCHEIFEIVPIHYLSQTLLLFLAKRWIVFLLFRHSLEFRLEHIRLYQYEF